MLSRRLPRARGSAVRRAHVSGDEDAVRQRHVVDLHRVAFADAISASVTLIRRTLDRTVKDEPSGAMMRMLPVILPRALVADAPARVAQLSISETASATRMRAVATLEDRRFRVTNISATVIGRERPGIESGRTRTAVVGGRSPAHIRTLHARPRRAAPPLILHRRQRATVLG